MEAAGKLTTQKTCGVVPCSKEQCWELRSFRTLQPMLTNQTLKLPFPFSCGSPLTYALIDHSEVPWYFPKFYYKSNIQFHTKKDMFWHQGQSFEKVESSKARVVQLDSFWLKCWLFALLFEKNASNGLRGWKGTFRDPAKLSPASFQAVEVGYREEFLKTPERVLNSLALCKGVFAPNGLTCPGGQQFQGLRGSLSG